MPTSPLPNSSTAPFSAPIRVLCIDDSPDITEMLGRCIERQPDMESVGSLSSANNLRSALDKLRPDVVLLDISMPGDDPLTALRGLTDGDVKNRPALPIPVVRVIVFSGHSDKQSMDRAADAGAWGYVSKDAPIPVILDAIRSVARGNVTFES
jgi:DNA-binding NarL/FixJ family response regulator